MESQSYKPIITLQLRSDIKSIPYNSQERETFQSSNHGFKVLKGKLSDISLIPEAEDNQHIISALKIINDEKTSLFSVGCEKSFNYEDSYGYWAKGYIEFSFNFVELVSDAQWYFALFFQFNHFVWENKFNLPVMFDWEFDRGIFIDADNQAGYTSAVWITTKGFQTEEEAQTVWETSLDFLADFLGQFSPNTGTTRIY